MNVTDLLKRDTVIVNLQSTSKDAVIDELAQKLQDAGRLNDLQGFKDAIHAREAQSTTGIGEGIAIPHAKTAAVKTPAICFGKSTDGVDYESLDGQPAHLFFMIAASEGANNAHLETLSKLSSLLMDAEFRQSLLAANTEEEIIALFASKEGVEEKEEVIDTKNTEQLVLAVTACPTGIAHTYMAADALKAKAKEMGVTIKVETNGSTGIKNALTEEEIEKATAIIVAADKKVETNRFKGKHVITVPVAAGIRQSEELITRALEQDAPIYQGDGGSSEAASSGSGERRGVYKHLMNGISNMLPFVIGGGILIALSFIWGIDAVNPDDPSYSVLAATLKQIGDSAFAFLVPILAGFIAISIGDRPAFMPGVVAGYLTATAGGGFIGGIVAGFLAGYAVVFIKKALDKLPHQLDGVKSVFLLPVIGILVVGLLMTVINVPIVAINTGLNNWLNSLGGANAVLLGALLGGMMAIDMGGPFNKAAYAFGIGVITTNEAPIAAVMAGGMVPPLAIALATTFFKNKFTKQERSTTLTNYVMGASFITEGAIPFAAADPLRVITSSVIGAATAGGLTALFGITLPAPHGGIFVIPFTNDPLKYILAILIGAAVSAVILGLWKKPVDEK